MANSQNGWPIATAAQQDRAPLIRNVTVPNGVLAGDVAVVFRWLARQYDARVERLIPGWCWGWFVKVIEGSVVKSNHGSGTAVDFNAPDNPMAGGSTERSLTDAQIRECHEIEEESGGVLRWGGDFSRDDPMHWEIVATPARTKRFADEIRADVAGGEEFDDMTQDEFNRMLATGLKAAAKVDPLATLLARSGASTNKQEPEMARDLEEVKSDVAEVKTALGQILAKLNETEQA